MQTMRHLMFMQIIKGKRRWSKYQLAIFWKVICPKKQQSLLLSGVFRIKPSSKIIGKELFISNHLSV